jgi:hypothetical protein
VRCITAGELILGIGGLGLSDGMVISGLDRAVRRRGMAKSLELRCWGESDTGLGGAACEPAGVGETTGPVLAGADIGLTGSIRGERFAECPSLLVTLTVEASL